MVYLILTTHLYVTVKKLSARPDGSRFPTKKFLENIFPIFVCVLYFANVTFIIILFVFRY